MKPKKKSVGFHGEPNLAQESDSDRSQLKMPNFDQDEHTSPVALSLKHYDSENIKNSEVVKSNAAGSVQNKRMTIFSAATSGANK